MSEVILLGLGDTILQTTTRLPGKMMGHGFGLFGVVGIVRLVVGIAVAIVFIWLLLKLIKLVEAYTKKLK